MAWAGTFGSVDFRVVVEQEYFYFAVAFKSEHERKFLH